MVRVNWVKQVGVRPTNEQELWPKGTSGLNQFMRDRFASERCGFPVKSTTSTTLLCWDCSWARRDIIYNGERGRQCTHQPAKGVLGGKGRNTRPSFLPFLFSICINSICFAVDRPSLCVYTYTHSVLSSLMLIQPTTTIHAISYS